MKTQTKHVQTQRILQAAVESLETRRFLDGSAVLADGVLTVTGTEKKDAIVFSLGRDDTETLFVKLNKQSFEFSLDEVSKVVVDGLGGNDKITVNEKFGVITLPFVVDGGAGNDAIVTGSGDDVVQGDEGNDKVSGGGGDDQVDGGAGNDVLGGGGDNDTLLGEDGKDKLDGGVGDDNLDGGAGKDALKTGGGDDAVAVDDSNPREIKGRNVDPRTYRVTSLEELRSDIAQLHEAVVPGSHVTRVEEVDGVFTMYYHFDGDPKLYKTVVDGSGEDLELVNREISPNELREPALQQFQARYPGVEISSVLQHGGGRFDIRYRDADGVMHEVQTEDLIWGLDDAESDQDGDGIQDHYGEEPPDGNHQGPNDGNGQGGPNGGPNGDPNFQGGPNGGGDPNFQGGGDPNFQGGPNGGGDPNFQGEFNGNQNPPEDPNLNGPF